MMLARYKIPWLTMVGLIMMLNPTFTNGGDESPWAQRRQNMLRSIAEDVARHGNVMGSNHLSDEVAHALATVPRHLFVPKRLRPQAYANHPLPIGQGQTISQPTIVAMMTELMAVGSADTILEVGTGSGYQAAVLAEIVAHVFTIEIIPELARSAEEILADLDYENVTVYAGDGYAGLPDEAPFDAIMVTAAPPTLPSTLLDQLKTGGRLVAPVGPDGATQWLTVWIKQEDGTCRKKVIIPVRFVPMVRQTNEKQVHE